MLACCSTNKFLIFVKSCLCYLLCNRYALSYVLLDLKVVYNLKTFANQYLIKIFKLLFVIIKINICFEKVNKKIVAI